MAKKNTVAESENVAYKTTKNKEKKVQEKVVESVPEKTSSISAEDFLDKASTFFSDKKNRNFFLIALGGVLLLIGGFVGFSFWKNSQNETAQQYMSPAVFYLEKDSLKTALNGDGVNDGLITIADDYGMTDAGNLANFYAGVAYLKQGKFDDAIERLKKFGSSDMLLQARVYALIGDAYSEKNDLDNALNYYQKAASYKENKYLTLQYLMKLALTQELKKDTEGAIKTYEQVIASEGDVNSLPYDIQNSVITVLRNAKKYKARLESQAGK